VGEGGEMWRAFERLYRSKFHDDTVAVFFRQPDAAGTMKRTHEFIAVDDIAFVQDGRDGEGACRHGVQFARLLDVEHEGAHVIERFFFRLLACGEDDAACGTVAGERGGELGG
jgi:hypothetical protein